jgi:glucokinase
MGRYAVGIDIGRTNLRAALVRSNGELVASIKEGTDALGGPQGVERQVARAFERLARGHDVRAVGVGIAGQCDTARGVVLHGPNLFWPDVPFRDRLSDVLGVPVVLRNDVVMATIGEWRHGAGRDCHDIVVLFSGTGIGGGAIVNGTLLEGASGCGGHFGHVSVQLDGPPCGCGRRGCVEAYASGTGLASRAKNDPSLPSSSLSLVDEIDGRAISRAVEEGDALAVRLRDEAALALSSAIGSVINCLEPQRVVLGGSVMDMPGLYEMCAAGALEHCLPSHRRALVVRSALGEMAGAIGAASLAFDPV